VFSAVEIFYIGSLADGTIFDERRTGEPLSVRLGMKMVPPGLEEALLAMKSGEERVVTLSPEKGYGAYDEAAVVRYPLFSLPNGDKLPVGEMIELWSEKADRPAYAKVLRVVDEVAFVDFNHPLAGQELHYWLKVVSEKQTLGPKLVRMGKSNLVFDDNVEER
jgi:FKBP-type peptidyl-prolyl cis-trans isomerase 2